MAQWPIVALGDSWTKRTNVTNHAADWPQFLQPAIGVNGEVINAGLAGNFLADMIARLTSDVLAQTPRYTVVFGGINDNMSNAETVDPTPITNDLTTLYSRCIAAGERVIGVTITPWNSVGWTANRETQRQAVNAWIMANASLWGKINLEPVLADASIPAHPVLMSQYDIGDGIHPNPAAARAVANAVYLQAFGAPLGKPPYLV